MDRLLFVLTLCMTISLWETPVFCQGTGPISRPSSAPRRTAAPPNAPRASRPGPPPQGGPRPPVGPMGHRPPPGPRGNHPEDYSFVPPNGPYPPGPMHRPPIGTSVLWVNSYIRNTTNNYNNNYNTNNYNIGLQGAMPQRPETPKTEEKVQQQAAASPGYRRRRA